MEFEDFAKNQPELVAALRRMSAAATAQGLEKPLLELVKIRVSQINGCAFCLQFHLNLARQLGVGERKLGLLAAWREAGIFDAREMAALAYAERLTLLAQAHLGELRPRAGGGGVFANGNRASDHRHRRHQCLELHCGSASFSARPLKSLPRAPVKRTLSLWFFPFLTRASSWPCKGAARMAPSPGGRWIDYSNRGWILPPSPVSPPGP